jgi:exopolyphosphatase/guanosine-5'-triphosphate,3'-diphosphate pyrophosphatase
MNTPLKKNKLFPLRVASIDTGSNGIRFEAAEFSAPDVWQPLASERLPVRLGKSVFISGSMESRAMDAAVAAFGAFAGHLKEHHIRHYRAVATSAVRESANGELFARRVAEETGITLQIITGSEEARYAHRAVRHSLALGNSKWVMADLGGGSLEVSLIDDAGILWSESHAMGAIRLAESLTGMEEDRNLFQRLLTEYISTLRIPHAEYFRSISGLIATGGNIEALARLGGSTRNKDGVASLSTAKLSSVVMRLSKLSYRQRVTKLGLHPDRADVIVPAAMVFLRLAEMAKVKGFIVPFVGLKEGIMLDLVDEIVGKKDHAIQMDRKISAGALAVGRRYQFDEQHGMHVSKIALSLFDQLQELHGLGPENRPMLLVAAILHDIGMFVSREKHHKHSYYLIVNSDIPGFALRQLRIAADIARYHRKSEPAMRHESFAALSKGDRRVVEVLTAILRLADALDREHLQNVASVKVTIEPKTVILRPAGKGDLLLEHWALKNRSKLFSRLFGRAVSILGGGID